MSWLWLTLRNLMSDRSSLCIVLWMAHVQKGGSYLSSNDASLRQPSTHDKILFPLMTPFYW